MRIRPFRFGVITGFAQSRADWVARARRAEELGYASLHVRDHINIGLAPLTALAIAAEATTHLRVGAMVFCNDFHHPALLAKEIATLDLLSDGRCEVGLGAGYLQSDYDQTGIPFDDGSTRVSRLEEAVQIIKRLLSEEQVTFSGQHYTITGMKGLPRSVQKPHPPIFIGGGQKRLLSIAAQHADSIGIGFARPSGELANTPPEAIQQRVDWIRQTAGERIDRLELGYTVYVVKITESPQAAANLPLPASLHVAKGTLDQLIDELQERREKYGFSCIQVAEAFMEAFAPVVSRLAGK